MKLNYLGTGAGLPSLFRNVSSQILDLSNEIGQYWMFDCGEGTQRQMIKTTLSPVKISKLFITHLHGDHIFGSPGMLSSMSNMGKEGVLEIYAPEGYKEWLISTLKLTKTRLKFKLKFITIKNGMVLDLGKFNMYVKELNHDVSSYAYKIEQKDLPGVLDAKKATSLGVPNGPLMGKLKNGLDVTLPNGTIVKSEDVVGDNVKGKVIVICGDTAYHPNLVEFCKNADVLVHESTYLEGFDEGDVKYKFKHSSNMDAVRIAKEANVKLLLLNHISSRYSPEQVKSAIKVTRNKFKNSTLLKDFDVIEIK